MTWPVFPDSFLEEAARLWTQAIEATKDDPSPSQFFWIGPGRFDKAKGETSAVEGVWIDRIEITSVPSVSRR